MKKLLPILLILTAAACGWLTSCENGCEQMRESFMHIGFTSTTSRALSSLSIDAHGRRDGMVLSDSTTLRYMTAKLTKYEDIELELNPNDSLVTFVLHSQYSDYGDKFTADDTVRVVYKAEGRFLDMECGCTVDYTIEQVTCTHNLLQEVRIEEKMIHTESGKNLEFIY